VVGFRSDFCLRQMLTYTPGLFTIPAETPSYPRCLQHAVGPRSGCSFLLSTLNSPQNSLFFYVATLVPTLLLQYVLPPNNVTAGLLTPPLPVATAHDNNSRFSLPLPYCADVNMIAGLHSHGLDNSRFIQRFLSHPC
jgi:hypothetical protein